MKATNAYKMSKQGKILLSAASNDIARSTLKRAIIEAELMSKIVPRSKKDKLDKEKSE